MSQQRIAQPQTGLLYRLIQALTGVFALTCIVCGYLGLRAIVWRHNADLTPMLTSGLIISLSIGAVLGGLYLLLGARGLRLVMRFRWINVQLGLVMGMALYGLYNALWPLLPTYGREHVLMRALQGAVDGALIGAVAGALVAIIDPRPISLRMSGALRYTVLFLLVLLAIAVSIFIAAQPSIPRNAAFWLLIPLVLVLRLAVGVYDRFISRSDRFVESTPEEYDDPYTE